MWRAGIVVVIAAVWGCGGDDDGGPVGPVTVDGLVRACAIYSACQQGDPSVDQCVAAAGPVITDEQVACVNGATAADCEAVRSCLGYRIVPDLHCEPGCVDADTVVQCGETVRLEIDCPRFIEQVGPSCVLGMTRIDCGGGTCDVDGEHTCSGTIATACDSGITEVRDCARWGLDCDAGGCVGVAEGACAPGTPAACDGDRVIECLGTARRIRDCARWTVGMTCVAPSPGNAVCGYGTACDPLEVDTCDGTTLETCVAGARRAIDCRSIGATTCQAFAVTDAFCRP